MLRRVSRLLAPFAAGLPLFAMALPHVGAETVEQQVKAAFLYRFAQFVEWPAEQGRLRELVLCTLGEDAFNGALAAIEGKSVREARLVVRRIAAPGELGQCQMAFIRLGGTEPLVQALRQSRSAHVLTVSDQPGFAAAGGMIELVRVDNRLQFEINLGAARQAELHVSARLLRLARVVHNRPQD